MAEKLVRDFLIKKHKNLKWTSENSDIPSERNTSKVYDMECLLKEGKKYIEVKAATNSFYMSSSEYEFALNNRDNNEIYLVDLENNKIDGPHRIEEFEKLKIATEYQFKFKEMKKN